LGEISYYKNVEVFVNPLTQFGGSQTPAFRVALETITAVNRYRIKLETFVCYATDIAGRNAEEI
jgi:hypothetical protein